MEAPFSSYKQIHNILTMIWMKSHYLYVSINSCVFQSRFTMLMVIFPSDFCVMSVALCYYLLCIIRKAVSRKGFTKSGLNKMSDLSYGVPLYGDDDPDNDKNDNKEEDYYHFYLNSCWNWSYQVSDASCWIHRIRWISPCAFCHRQARSHHHHLL